MHGPLPAQGARVCRRVREPLNQFEPAAALGNALIDGNCDLANSSRTVKADEIRKVEAAHGAQPKEFVVGYDALAIYVHKDNPLNEITIQQLADIYGEGGTITRWSQVDGGHRGDDRDTIVRVSRQNSSGTYFYFREHVLGNKDFKPGSRDMSGSKDVVELVGRTQGAIGYSGMGYHTDEVKWLKVSEKKGETGVEPSIAAVRAWYSSRRPRRVAGMGRCGSERGVAAA